MSMAIIVNSSDGYRDCWPYFFHLLKKYYPPSMSYEVILNTNTQSFSDPDLEITVSCSEFDDSLRLSWSQRLQKTLDNVQSDIVLIMFEDYFLTDFVKFSELDKFTALMTSNTNIDHIRLAGGPWTTSPTTCKHLRKIKRFSKYRVSLQPGLWRRDSLKKILLEHESAWDVEIFGSFRSFFSNHNYFCLSSEYLETEGSPISVPAAGVIRKGRWVESDIREIADRENLEIDFSVRGFDSPDSVLEKWSRRARYFYKSPNNLLRSLGAPL